MTRYLIDTNVFIWFIEGDDRLPVKFRPLINDLNNTVWLSIASLWEMTIKISRGNLLPNIDLENYIQTRVYRSGFKILPIRTNHLLTLRSLPFHHKDPFDRMIISQSLSENLTLLYTDEVFKEYFESKNVEM